MWHWAKAQWPLLKLKVPEGENEGREADGEVGAPVSKFRSGSEPSMEMGVTTG